MLDGGRFTMGHSKEQALEYARMYRDKNREMLRAKARLYQQTHKRNNRTGEVRQRSRNYYQQHKEARQQYAREYYHNHEEIKREQQRQRVQELKRTVIDVYGKVCQCCGETRLAFLCIDHINGKGNEHRKKQSTGLGSNFYQYQTSMA